MKFNYTYLDRQGCLQLGRRGGAPQRKWQKMRFRPKFFQPLLYIIYKCIWPQSPPQVFISCRQPCKQDTAEKLQMTLHNGQWIVFGVFAPWKLVMFFLEANRQCLPLFKIRALLSPYLMELTLFSTMTTGKQDPFRKAYSRLGELRAFLDDVPYIALTATATAEVISTVSTSLEMQSPRLIYVRKDKPNIS